MSSAVINRNFITQVNQDSGSLTSATTVVHRFGEGEHGEYKGVLYDRRGVAVGEFSISVGGDEPKSEKHEEEGHSGQHLPMSVEVYLTSLHPTAAGQGSPSSDWEEECGCEDAGAGGELKVASEGYAVFKVPAGAAGGYAVELYKSAESGRGEKVFDSRSLSRSDLLAVVLLRPGAYSVTNASNGTKAELKVAYPEMPLGLLEPVKVACAGGAISPAVIKVQPAQGLVFSFETPSRVKIELVAPDDRPRPSVPVAPPSKAAAGAAAKKHGRRLHLAPRHPART